MSLSFGGLGLLSPWTPTYIWDESVHTRSEFRSFVFALVFVAVILILAYLTNPSEISFRAYLTEQSFRQHLSHLDDSADDSSTELNCNLSRSRARTSDCNSTTDRTTLPFHFANRASVSLRTPKHVFHSFGICTIATTRGASPASGRRTSNGHSHSSHGSDFDGSVSSDSWFIGAFGRWWRGGLVESWYYDAMARSKDTEGWSSGILGFKALDKLHDYNGLPFSKLAACPRPLLRGSPPKLRNRERSSQRSGPLSHRSSSPPPLPKSVSLPLHADHRLHELLPPTSQSSHPLADQRRVSIHSSPVSHSISRSPSTSGISDHSPIITEVLRQITTAQASVHDLQNQLKEAQDAADQSRDSLEAELGELRTRRREEEQKRVDGRARTKSLEETRRLAEMTKKDAEKKMKVARHAKESAIRRVEELELEIQRLKERMEQDRMLLAAEPDGADTVEEELICELERKRKEVRVAEEIVVALNTRARELEDRIMDGKSRLRAAQERAKSYPDSLEVFQTSLINVSHCGKTETSTWTSSYNPLDLPVDNVLLSLDTLESLQGDVGTEESHASHSPKSAGLNSGTLDGSGGKDHVSIRSTVFRPQSRVIFDDDISAFSSAGSTSHISDNHNNYLQSGQATPFSPFGEPQTPSSAFIPSSLISDLDSPVADWTGSFTIGTGSFSSSPVSYGGHSDPESDLDSFDVRRTHGKLSDDQLSMLQETHERVGSRAVLNKGADTSSKGRFDTFSTKEKQRSGLNPDAKVFCLPRRTSDKGPVADVSRASSSYDALNPTGLTPHITSSTPSSLLRAFAPSRAEREALQRALGGSTNASLERLPSLSDVGSIPSSPAHVHAEARGRGIGEKDSALPVWLQSLPLIRKPNFSPWEDEDFVSVSR